MSGLKVSVAPTKKMPTNPKQQPGYCGSNDGGGDSYNRDHQNDGDDDGGGDGDGHDVNRDGSNREDASQFQTAAWLL